GQKMVDMSDAVMAVWNGQPANGKGGTADIVVYAQGKNKDIHIIKGIRKSEEGKANQQQKSQEAFNKYDQKAVVYKRFLFEPAWIAGIILGVLAAISFAIGIALKFSKLSESRHIHTVKFILPAFEIVFLSLSFLLLAWLAKRWKRIFL